MIHRVASLVFGAALLSLPVSFAEATVAEPQVTSALHETTLYSFTGATGAPTTGLIAGADDVFYGATAKTVYELYQDTKKKWQVKTLYTFAGATSANVNITSLIVSGGVIYGSSTFGGSANCVQYGTRGCGFVFSLTASKGTPVKWTEKTIYKLAGEKNAAEPVGLVSPKGGSLYVMSEVGGDAAACGSNNGNATGCGTLIQLTSDKTAWTEKILHRFTGGTDGGFPMTAPSLDAAGNVYFSTYLGGTSAATNETPAARPIPAGLGQGCGSVGFFSESFFGIIAQLACISAQGDYPSSQPYAGVASRPQIENPGIVPDAAANANFALATAQGGGNTGECSALGNNGCGTVFLLTQPAKKGFPWTNRTLHRFTGVDGSSPSGALLADGNSFYGVAVTGGINCPSQSAIGCGVIYALAKTADGFSYAGTAYKFRGTKDGATPRGELALSRGQIFATTQAGGRGQNGTIVMLAP